MKEEKYYCDRCGKEISVPKSLGGFFSGAATLKCEEIKRAFDVNDTLADALTVALNSNYKDSITFYFSGMYTIQETHYELCRNCANDFNRFMNREG